MNVIYERLMWLTVIRCFHVARCSTFQTAFLSTVLFKYNVQNSAFFFNGRHNYRYADWFQFIARYKNQWIGKDSIEFFSKTASNWIFVINRYSAATSTDTSHSLTLCLSVSVSLCLSFFRQSSYVHITKKTKKISKSTYCIESKLIQSKQSIEHDLKVNLLCILIQLRLWR